MGTVQGGKTYSWGSEVELMAICKQGYAFLYWSELNSSGTEIAQHSANPLTFTASVDRTFKAMFGKAAEGISVTATKGGAAYVLGNNYESLGQDDTIILYAKLILEGYEFSHWEDMKGNNLGTDTSIKFKKSVIFDNVITAVFVPINNGNVNTDTSN